MQKLVQCAVPATASLMTDGATVYREVTPGYATTFDKMDLISKVRGSRDMLLPSFAL
jgi:hypothetical protein